jgi:hypothetical membrane protein
VKTKYLLYSGILIPIVFWSTTFICSAILGEYKHLSRMVSELGELGTRTQHLFTIGLTLCGILCIPFVIGLYRSCKLIGISYIPIIILLFYATTAGPAIFPYPLRLHGILGIPSVLIIFSPLLSLFLWTGNLKLSSIKFMSILSLIVMIMGFSVLVPEFLDQYLGLKQRFFHLGWSLWFIYLSSSFINLIDGHEHTSNTKVWLNS